MKEKIKKEKKNPDDNHPKNRLLQYSFLVSLLFSNDISRPLWMSYFNFDFFKVYKNINFLQY